MNYQAAEFSWTMHRLGKCHSSNYRLCAYIRKPEKCRFYTCIFIEKGFRKALRTDNLKKKAVFVCTPVSDHCAAPVNSQPYRVSWTMRWPSCSLGRTSSSTYK